MKKIYLHRFREKLELRGFSDCSVKAYCSCVRLFFAYLEEKENVRAIEDITPDHLTAYHTYLQFEKRHKGNYLCKITIRHRLHPVKVFLRTFHEEGMLPQDISHNIVLPKCRMSLPRDIPTPKQVVELLEAVKPLNHVALRNRCMLELVYATGIRVQELLNLTVAGLNLSDKTLLVHGKGAKDRMVPIGDWVMPWLIEYLEAVRPVFHNPKCPTDVLFLSFRGYQMDRSIVRDLLHLCLEKTALACNITAHTLRHACATHMLQGGADIRYIQELLGHSSLSTTQIYTRVDITSLKKAHLAHHPRQRTENVD